MKKILIAVTVPTLVMLMLNHISIYGFFNGWISCMSYYITVQIYDAIDNKD